MPKVSAKTFISQYADEVGISPLEAYWELIDMGEIRESDLLLSYATKHTTKAEVARLMESILTGGTFQ